VNSPIEHGHVTANGLEFACLEAGEGPLALCLHGFPDSAWSWAPLLEALAGEGYHAVAPFMRGYAPTAVPSDGLYQTGALARDAIELHSALGGDGDAVIIGHDWGAIATYTAAAAEPGRWRRVVTMAVPPMGAVSTGFMSYAQLHRSWYMFFFQHPLSDVVVGMNDLAFLDGLWTDWSPGFDGSEGAAHAKDCLRGPANLAAALGYYRAMLGDGKKDPELSELEAAASQPPPQPTLYLHGTTDGCMGVDIAATAGDFLSPGSRMELVEGAGHFLQLEKPATVNRLVTDFLKG
jgi:pimeloyl-ACP methyl ester carboxylesterase